MKKALIFVLLAISAALLFVQPALALTVNVPAAASNGVNPRNPSLITPWNFPMPVGPISFVISTGGEGALPPGGGGGVII